MLLSIMALLESIEPDNPQDAEVAQQYITNYDQFKETAQEWVKKYAQEEIYDPKKDVS